MKSCRSLPLLLACSLVTGAAVAQREAPPHSELVVERTEELNLAVGETKSLSASEVKSFSEGIRGIADVRLTPDSSQFIVVGQKSGATTLLLIKKDGSQLTYNINVFSRSPASVERELSQLLDGTPGVRMRRVGARFFIEGGVSSEPALKRIEQIAALFPGQVESLVVLGGGAADRRLNLRIDFLFVQFDRSKSYQVGVSWPAQIGGSRRFLLGGEFDFLTGVVGAARATVVDQPLPALDLAANKGWAKVLKYSTVVTANGTEANFSSGGEQNYVISSGFGASLTQVRFGTDVKVLPRFDPGSRELEVQLAAEVMDLTPPVAAGTDLPGRNVSKLSTLVSLKLGQSIVLSGIRTRSQRHSVSGLPLLSEIPILGVFFGSHGDMQEDVEGAIYVVPSIIEAVPKSAQEIVDEALREYKKYDGAIDEARIWETGVGNPPPRGGDKR